MIATHTRNYELQNRQARSNKESLQARSHRKGEGRATFYDLLETIRDFLDQGGQVISVIAWVIFVMWTLIVERVLYLRTTHPHRVAEALGALASRPDAGSWSFEAIRQGTISRLDQRLRTRIPVIQTLAAICPLLGLLGTVTGMIVIFDVMAAMGNSSPRAVAGGVAQATLTTMAGMVGALSGVFPAAFLARAASKGITDIQHSSFKASEQALPSFPCLGATVRLPVSLVVAFFVTMGLVYGMQRLIETGERALTDDTQMLMLDFVRIQREETIEQKRLKPDKPPPPDTQPEIAPVPQDVDQSSGAVAVNFGSGRGINPGIGINVLGVSGYDLTDGDYLPLVKVTPIYPRRAQARGLNGKVIVQFTVTATGTVRDVVVIESTNKIFEKAAVQAALRFKYRPRVVNGVPVEVTGVYHSIVFEVIE